MLKEKKYWALEQMLMRMEPPQYFISPLEFLRYDGKTRFWGTSRNSKVVKPASLYGGGGGKRFHKVGIAAEKANHLGPAKCSSLANRAHSTPSLLDLTLPAVYLYLQTWFFFHLRCEPSLASKGKTAKICWGSILHQSKVSISSPIRVKMMTQELWYHCAAPTIMQFALFALWYWVQVCTVHRLCDTRRCISHRLPLSIQSIGCQNNKYTYCIPCRWDRLWDSFLFQCTVWKSAQLQQDDNLQWSPHCVLVEKVSYLYALQDGKKTHKM